MLCLRTVVFLVSIISINCSAIEIELTTQSLDEQVLAEARMIKKLQAELEKEENQLKLDRQQFERNKQLIKSVHSSDVIELNVAGEIIATTRQILTCITKSIPSLLFNGRWEHKLPIDEDENIRLDYNPTLFRHLLHQLQTFDSNNLKQILPPSQPALVKPFKKMLTKLGLNELLSSEKKNIITFNVGGQTITNRRTTFTAVSNSTFDTIVSPPKTIDYNDKNDVFVDYDSHLFRSVINQLRSERVTNISSLTLRSYDEKVALKKMLVDLNIHQPSDSLIQIDLISKWMQNGTTVAGLNGRGGGLNQLFYPHAIHFDDDDQSIFVADHYNHRIVQWKPNASNGQIIAGGNGQGNHIKQLNYPSDFILNKRNNSLIIADRGNARIVHWSGQNYSRVEVLIHMDVFGLATAKDGSIYISSYDAHEVKRWKPEERNATTVAGGNGQGNHLKQLYNPRSIFVDENYSLYIVDHSNHRVMKWPMGAKEGIIVAGGNGKGNSTNQLNFPHGLIVDQFERIYVADSGNHRIVRWSKDAKEGVVLVGGNGKGSKSNQFDLPYGLTFDRRGNLYVADSENHRVQKFPIQSKF